MPPKDKDKGGDSPFAEKKHFNHTMGMLVVLILLGGVVTQFYYSFRGFDTSFLGEFIQAIIAWFRDFWPTWKWIAAILSILSVMWAIVNALKLKGIEKEEKAIYENREKEISTLEMASVKKENEKWLRVLAHANSGNPPEWRLAIMEADIMLDELLRGRGYPGDSIGDMLKTIDPSDMLTLQAAWEAHLVRNRIAHSGADFQLNERETKRVVALFESVFKEAQII